MIEVPQASQAHQKAPLPPGGAFTLHAAVQLDCAGRHARLRGTGRAPFPQVGSAVHHTTPALALLKYQNNLASFCQNPLKIRVLYTALVSFCCSVESSVAYSTRRYCLIFSRREQGTLAP